MQTWVRTIGFVRKTKRTEKYDFCGNECYVALSVAVSIIKCGDLQDIVGSSSTNLTFDAFPIGAEIHAVLNALSNDCKCDAMKGMTGMEWSNESALSCAMLPYDYKRVRACDLHTKYAPYYFVRIRIEDNDHYYSKQGEFVWYLIHPDERERMERILNGTDNPLYDLVHQLMYNPDVLPAEMIRSRREAKEHFEEQKKRKIE